MSRRAVTFALAAAPLLAAAIFWIAREESESPPPATRPSVEAAAGPAAAPSAAPVRGAEALPASLPAPPTLPAVTGRLFDSESREPIPDARVFLVTDNSFAFDRAVATTSASGEFAITPESFLAEAYAFGKEGYFSERGISLAPGDHLELALARGTPARARVVDLRSRDAIPGARVTIEDREILESGPDGRFAFVAAPRIASIEVDADGYERGRFTEVATTEAGSEIELALAAQPLAFVRVTDAATGLPLETAQLFVRGAAPHDRARGLYLVHVPAPGMRLTAIAPGYARASLDVAPGAGTREADALEIALLPAGTIEGIVRDATGRPLHHASVNGETADGRTTVTSASTDAEGRFRLEGVLPGAAYRLRIDHWYCEETLVEEVHVPNRNPVAIPDVTLAASDMLRGIVRRDADLAPLAGARVELRENAHCSSTWTATDGTFSVPRPAGAAELVVRAHGLATRIADVAGDETEPIEIRLDGGAAIEGSVILESGQPASGCRVRATYRDVDRETYHRRPGLFLDREEFDAVSDRDGAFRIAGLPAGGRYEVVPRSGMNVGRLVSPSMEGPIEAGTTGLVFRLEPPTARSGFRGRVVSATDGRPIDGLRVMAAREAQDGRRMSFEPVQRVTANEFFVPIEPGRPVTLRVAARGHATRELEPIDVAPGELKTETVALDPGGSLAGVARLGDGTPAARVELEIELQGTATLGVPPLTTDSEGRFAWPELEPGDYVIEARGTRLGPNGESITTDAVAIPATVTIRSGERAALDLGIERPSGALVEGRLDFRSAPPRAPLVLEFHLSSRLGPRAAATVRLAPGADIFAIDALAPGNYRVSASLHTGPPDRPTQIVHLGISPLYVQVPDGGTLSIRLALTGTDE